ncbi:MBOAT family O-acyltransferase [Myxacorys almedinensis]|uniref:MBOAT family protein n=1 Tax=Myxacorys almedinensis A TaxID=2690445 RepID=A0A8J8CIF9_9CYAN|nr:MBOAT family protein [Myxacorys almedinensis]NDJ17674.1 MBOAT family protein [Myxacorys almedinensis A]
MSFNSIEFAVLLVATYLLYRVLSLRGQNTLLLVASYAFYAWWDIRFLYLIVFSTVIDFACGAMIGSGWVSKPNRRLMSAVLLLAAIAFNTVQWQAVQLSLSPLAMAINWAALLPATWAGWWVLGATVLLVAIAPLFYSYSVALEASRRRTLFLVLSIVKNLLILGVFKYANFFAGSVADGFRWLGLDADRITLNLILPLGISFYTFKAISYIVDVYRGRMQASHHFWDFALFWAYFPPLLAGPIERATHLLPQLTHRRHLSFQQTSEGIFLILFGLFKKVAIADGVASSVNAVYGTTGAISWLDIVAATVLYALQIYADFSGYSDIGRGVSKLFGIELMLNFNLPYFSKTPSEFWGRWHISLSSWLRDYLYIPLGGSRQGVFKTYRNLMLTMLLGGLWHGAAWNFILWGGYQGALLCGYRAVSKIDPPSNEAVSIRNLLGSAPAIALFFGLTCYGWLLFRATSLEQVITFTRLLIVDFGNLSLSMPKPPLSALLGIPVWVAYECLEYLTHSLKLKLWFPTPLRAALYATLILILIMGESNAPAQFIYSQF